MKVTVRQKSGKPFSVDRKKFDFMTIMNGKLGIGDGDKQVYFADHWPPTKEEQGLVDKNGLTLNLEEA